MMLLVAPRNDLEYVDEEIKRVVNFLRPRVLLGSVTLSQVVDEIQAYPPDVIWFATHSTDQGIQLSDGLLTASMLAQLLKGHPPSLVFLNTCNSLPAAMEVHDAIGSTVIGTICDVPDREAFVTGSALARALGQGMDPAEAYNISRPSQNRKYILLNGAIKLNGEKDIDDTNQLLILIIKRQDELDKSLRGRIDELNNTVDDKFHRRLTFREAVFWVSGYLIFITSLFFQTREIFENLAIPVYASLAIMTLMQIIAGALIIRGIGFSFDEIKRGGKEKQSPPSQ